MHHQILAPRVTQWQSQLSETDRPRALRREGYDFGRTRPIRPRTASLHCQLAVFLIKTDHRLSADPIPAIELMDRLMKCLHQLVRNSAITTQSMRTRSLRSLHPHLPGYVKSGA
jgi:hypothetical protein